MVEWVLCEVSMVVGDRRSKDLITIEGFDHDRMISLRSKDQNRD